MIRFLKITSVLLVAGFIIVMCKNNPSGSDTITNGQYTLNVEIDPSSGNPGSVNPPGGTYDEGESVMVEATPNSSENWEFDHWEGASTSSNNPITITMNSDKILTAYFIQVNTADAFQASMNVTDGVHTRENLVFALVDGSGYQGGLDGNDVESPPIAPPGVFFTGFKHGGMNLYEDYRPLSDNLEEVIWELRLDRNSSNTMSIDWTFSNQVDSGNLKLVSDLSASNPTIEVDMLSQSSYSVSDPSINSLFIVYSASQAKSIMTNINAGQDKLIPAKPGISNQKGAKDISVGQIKIGNQQDIKN